MSLHPMQSLLRNVFRPLREPNAAVGAAATGLSDAPGGSERRASVPQDVHFGPEQRWAFLSSPAFDVPTIEARGPLWNSEFRVWRPSDNI